MGFWPCQQKARAARRESRRRSAKTPRTQRPARGRSWTSSRPRTTLPVTAQVNKTAQVLLRAPALHPVLGVCRRDLGRRVGRGVSSRRLFPRPVPLPMCFFTVVYGSSRIFVSVPLPSSCAASPLWSCLYLLFYLTSRRCMGVFFILQKLSRDAPSFF